MKKFTTVVLVLLTTIITTNAQSLFSHNDTTNYGYSGTIMTTYEPNHNYTLNPKNSNIDSAYYIDSNGAVGWFETSAAYKKYRNYTPGQLITECGRLKNKAVLVGLTTCVAGTFVATLPLYSDWGIPGVAYGIGGAIAFAGGVSALVLTVKANKLLQEAGTRMEKISITGNGIVIKF